MKPYDGQIIDRVTVNRSSECIPDGTIIQLNTSNPGENEGTGESGEA